MTATFRRLLKGCVGENRCDRLVGATARRWTRLIEEDVAGRPGRGYLGPGLTALTESSIREERRHDP